MLVAVLLFLLVVIIWLPFVLALALAARLRRLVRAVADHCAGSVPWLDRLRVPTDRLVAERDRMFTAVVGHFATAGWIGRLVGWLIRRRARDLCEDCERELVASGRPEVDLPWVVGYLAGIAFDRLLSPWLWLIGLVCTGGTLLLAGLAALLLN